ncbi:MAG: hypothetical protein WKF57_06810 [Nakamurella sp.]
MRLQRLVMVAICASTAALAGCAEDCSLVGGVPGVVIRNPAVLVERDAVEVRVCVTETACSSAVVPAAGSSLMVDSELLSAAVTAVTVSATDASGSEVYRETRPVIPRVSYPNGESCGPTVWRTAVTL